MSPPTETADIRNSGDKPALSLFRRAAKIALLPFNINRLLYDLLDRTAFGHWLERHKYIVASFSLAASDVLFAGYGLEQHSAAQVIGASISVAGHLTPAFFGDNDPLISRIVRGFRRRESEAHGPAHDFFARQASWIIPLSWALPTKAISQVLAAGAGMMAAHTLSGGLPFVAPLLMGTAGLLGSWAFGAHEYCKRGGNGTARLARPLGDIAFTLISATTLFTVFTMLNPLALMAGGWAAWHISYSLLASLPFFVVGNYCQYKMTQEKEARTASPSRSAATPQGPKPPARDVA